MSRKRLMVIADMLAFAKSYSLAEKGQNLSFSQHFASCFSFRVSELKECAEFNNVSLNA